MVDGIAVEVASGLWPAIVNAHVGAPIEPGRVPPASTYFWEQLAAVKYHEPVCVTFERRVAPVRAVKKLGDGVFKLHAERVTQNQWRDFGGAVDRHFEALPPGQGCGSPNIWGSIVAATMLRPCARRRPSCNLLCRCRQCAGRLQRKSVSSVICGQCSAGCERCSPLAVRVARIVQRMSGCVS